mgnify:CR=1 FL=1|tara:strand:- start:767 stop:1192 length:426 start_codon:yes stop_codon:yes gene_type:complete
MHQYVVAFTSHAGVESSDELPIVWYLVKSVDKNEKWMVQRAGPEDDLLVANPNIAFFPTLYSAKEAFWDWVSGRANERSHWRTGPNLEYCDINIFRTVTSLGDRYDSTRRKLVPSDDNKSRYMQTQEARRLQESWECSSDD